jgi:NAD(P)-dependent dehydrogenase (short-subunit alcohol dehydrogenase family)
MNKLEGKTALITGGTSGIGLAAAKAFVNEGAYTFITGRRETELAAAVKEIGRNVTGIQGDVSNLGDLDRLFAQIKREKGKLDIVFANAGVAKFAALGAITEELRLDLRHQCERPAFHGAEGATPFAGWRFHHPEFIRRRKQRVTNQ